MPLVKPTRNTPAKLALYREQDTLLSQYAQWAGAGRAAVVNEALRRLFEADLEWQAYRAKAANEPKS